MIEIGGKKIRERGYSGEVLILLKIQFPDYIFGSMAVGIYILLRAVDRFAANYNSFPGQFDRQCLAIFNC